MASEQERKALEDLEDRHEDEQVQGQQDEHHEDDEAGESQAAQDDQHGTDEDREAIRAARREERRARKDRAKEREQTYIRQISSLARQNQDLAGRLAQLERKQTGFDFARVDGAIQEAAQAAEYWKGQIAAAAAAGADGAGALAEAQENFYVARRRAEDLVRLRKGAAQQAQAPTPMDPEVIKNVQEWAKNNRWYDPTGRDSDSRIVQTLDDQLTTEGFDPRTPEYWEELDSRARSYLPHRYARRPKPVASTGEKVYEGDGAAGSPVTGSDREVRGPNGSGAYKLSPERVAALKESGMWDDPAKRAKMIKRYQEMDRELRQRGA